MEAFENETPLREISSPKIGMRTGDNERFLRKWFEVSTRNFKLDCFDKNESLTSEEKWFPYNKGGEYRKWYGNNEYVVNWLNDGYEIKENTRFVYPQLGDNLGWKISNESFYFQPSITWSFISSSFFGVRYTPKGFIFDVAGSSIFPSDTDRLWLTAFLCSHLAIEFMKVMNPTLSFQVGNVADLPVKKPTDISTPNNFAEKAIFISRQDWDNFEASWDFKTDPLIRQKSETVQQAFENWEKESENTFQELKRLEEENNLYWIEAYGLQDELSHEVPDAQITIRRADLTRDIKSLISYAVGCIFGRYSLDKEGLILANQGETIEDYLQKIPNPSFTPDRDNVIPIIEGDWFTDDISEQFRKFLRLTFGEENYQTNLTFIENALDKPIQKYFLKDFYNDHVKRYKKRPIYWLFSSPKGSFNALIYLHRYRPDTASIVLNDYLREYRAKLTAHKTHLEAVSIDKNATQSEKTKALKNIENLRKIIDELEKYERDILYPLASQQLAIDLDDGVKVNYVKFGAALKKIAGLDATDD